MKPIRNALIALLILIPALWFLADSFPQTLGWFAWRTPIVQLSGLLTIGAMSAAMLLAMRPAWLEKRLDGLDKMYRLHKWLGISALVTGLMHWWWAQGTKWMVGWGWLARPERKPRPAGEVVDSLTQLLRDWRGPAEQVGEWAFYAAVVLIAIALIKRVSYRPFVKTHTILAALYLLLVWHSLVLINFSYWSQPIGWLTAALLISGSIAGVAVLCRRVGHAKKTRGRVASFHRDDSLLDLHLEVDNWRGHAPGQFAFLTTDRKEGAHPYTIASAWNPATKRLRFMIKALGDHTRVLPEQLAADAPVTVEGPYGCFSFDSPEPRQIWIGAGIGMTPFLAALEAPPSARSVDLFITTASLSPALHDELHAKAQAAGIALHITISPRDGYLTGDAIRAAVPDWKTASLWFCGPAGFGQSLEADFVAQGLSPEAFHRELFEMR